MPIDLTRRGFLAGLLGAAVIAVVPKAALVAEPVAAIDPFSITAPPGTTYQWVRCALLGEPDPENVEKRLGNGWTFVAPEVHPGAPVSTAEKAIEACGLILMQKPTSAVEEQLAVERAPRMDGDHRVANLLRRFRATDEDEAEPIGTAEELAVHLKGIGYTDADVRLWLERKRIA